MGADCTRQSLINLIGSGWFHKHDLTAIAAVNALT